MSGRKPGASCRKNGSPERVCDRSLASGLAGDSHCGQLFSGEVCMIWVVYHYRGTGVKYTGTESECQAWIKNQPIPDEYWKEKK